MNTGAWEGSTDWTLTGLGNLNDGRYHTLTVSISPAAFNVYCDAQNLKTVSGNTAKNTKNFVSAFFGEKIGEDLSIRLQSEAAIQTAQHGMKITGNSAAKSNPLSYLTGHTARRLYPNTISHTGRMNRKNNCGRSLRAYQNAIMQRRTGRYLQRQKRIGP